MEFQLNPIEAIAFKSLLRCTYTWRWRNTSTTKYVRSEGNDAKQINESSDIFSVIAHDCDHLANTNRAH